MIITLIIISIVTLLLIIFSRSAKVINSYTIVNYLFSISIALQWLISQKSIVYFFKNNYLFIDTLSTYEIIISGIIFLLAAIYARGYVDSLINAKELNPKNVKLFYITLNLLFLAVVLAFSSNNLALFWIFTELTTVLSAILIVILNAKENITAAIKYVFMVSTAMLFSLIGLIFLFALSKYSLNVSSLNWNILLENAQLLSPQLFTFSFVLIFIGFAAKSGIVPFHTWLPPAHSKAPSDTSVILSGCMINIGIYGIIRLYAIADKTSIQPFASNLLLAFGILSIAIASFSMIVRKNVKKLIAFSSIENMGLIVTGIGIGSGVALFWVLYHTLVHALTKALLFFSAGIIHRQYHDTKAEFIHDLLKLQPLAAIGITIGSIAIIGTPLFPLFISKFFILSELANISIGLLAVLLLFMLIVAGSFAWYYINLMGNSKDNKVMRYKVPFSMKLPIISLIVILLMLGIFIPEYLKIVLVTIVRQLGIVG